MRLQPLRFTRALSVAVLLATGTVSAPAAWGEAYPVFTDPSTMDSSTVYRILITRGSSPSAEEGWRDRWPRFFRTRAEADAAIAGLAASPPGKYLQQQTGLALTARPLANPPPGPGNDLMQQIVLDKDFTSRDEAERICETISDLPKRFGCYVSGYRQHHAMLGSYRTPEEAHSGMQEIVTATGDESLAGRFALVELELRPGTRYYRWRSSGYDRIANLKDFCGPIDESAMLSDLPICTYPDSLLVP